MARGQAPTAGPGAWRGWPWLSLLLALYIAADASGLRPALSGRRESPDQPAEVPPSRALGGDQDAPAANTTAAKPDAHAPEHGAHPQEALFFLVTALLLGTLLLHLSTFPAFKGLQQTVVLFLLGCCTSFAAQRQGEGSLGRHEQLCHGHALSGGLGDELGAFGRSYQMWMDVDPHLLLFALLPPLLAGDAMTIDTHVARSVAGQCLWLAGPGVAISAAVTAAFLWLYLTAWLSYEWPILLCLTVGAILCATDPVAVVALLKELGAPPSLTVQIQGEALLNDGTAIVLFTVANNMLKGEDYSGGDIFIYLMKTALYAWIFGSVVGGLFYVWIRAAGNKLDHHSGLIQVALTIACAYFSFIVAEGVFEISGVLATVAASLVLAHRMWPEIVCHTTMHTVWHMLEFIGNSVVFFLAGALTGGLMARIPFVNYIHLLVIYAALLVIRTGLIVLSLPILGKLNQPVPLPHALVMSWGGLRGAVGLALAIQVQHEHEERALRAGAEECFQELYRGDLVLFFVGGVALLTLTINATTCPALVRRLGITKTPMARLQLMLRLHRRLVEMLADTTTPSPVRRHIAGVLDEVKHHLHPQPSALRRLTQRGSVASMRGGGPAEGVGHRGSIASMVGMIVPDSVDVAARELAQEFQRARRKFEALPASRREPLLKHMPPSPLADQADGIAEVVQVCSVDPAMARAVNEAFLGIVRAQYWKQIQRGGLRPQEAHPLFMSVASALTMPCYELGDFACLGPHLDSPEEPGPRRPVRDCARAIVESLAFQAFIVAAIFVNSAIIFEEYRSDKEVLGSWLVLEAVFTGIFALEMTLKLAYLRRRYFLDPWCLFELLLVAVGVAGIAVQYQAAWGGAHDGGTEVADDEAQVARSVTVLKIMRSVRLVRVIQVGNGLAARCAGRASRLAVADHLERFEIFFFFARAHTAAQRELLRFLGPRSATDASDVARCLLESQASVYKALTICAYEMAFLDRWVLEEMHACHECIEVAEELETFVNDARASGLLNPAEADVLTHALTNHILKVDAQTSSMRSGRITLGPRYCAEHGGFMGEEGDDAAEAFADVKPGGPAEPRGARTLSTAVSAQDALEGAAALRASGHNPSAPPSNGSGRRSAGSEPSGTPERQELPLLGGHKGLPSPSSSGGTVRFLPPAPTLPFDPEPFDGNHDALSARSEVTSRTAASRIPGAGVFEGGRETFRSFGTTNARGLSDPHDDVNSEVTSRTAGSRGAAAARQPQPQQQAGQLARRALTYEAFDDSSSVGGGAALGAAAFAPGDAVSVFSASAGRCWVPGVIRSVSPRGSNVCVEYRQGVGSAKSLRKRLPADCPELRPGAPATQRPAGAAPAGQPHKWPARRADHRSPPASSLGRSWPDDDRSDGSGSL